MLTKVNQLNTIIFFGFFFFFFVLFLGGWGPGKRSCILFDDGDRSLLDTFFRKEIRIIFEFIFMDICPIGASETFESILYPNECFQTIKLISKNFFQKIKN